MITPIDVPEHVRRRLDDCPDWPPGLPPPRPEYVDIVAVADGTVVHITNVTRWPEPLIHSLIRQTQRDLHPRTYVVRRRTGT